MLKDFKAFVMRGNVVDMSIGIIIGAAFSKIVTSMVNDILMPPIGWLIGRVDFSHLVLNLKPPIGSGSPVAIRYGLFINNVIDFLIVAVCIFFLIKVVSDLVIRKKDDAAPTEKKCPQCAMSIPIEAKRCGHCTSVL